VDCAGALHPGTVAYLGRHFADTLVVACPPQNCLHREGTTLAHARILEERRPAVAGQIGRLPVGVLDAALGDWPRVVAAIDARRAVPGAGAARGPRRPAAVALGALLLVLLAAASRAPQGADADHAVLRLGWRLAGQTRERCRDLTAEELAARPVHLRRPRECVSEVLTYELTAAVDGRVVMRKRVASPGLRGDRPLSVEEELDVAPGEHVVRVTFTPEDPASGGVTLAFEETVRFAPARVVLVAYDNARLRAR
jgi:hypothetical protein